MFQPAPILPSTKYHTLVKPNLGNIPRHLITLLQKSKIVIMAFIGLLKPSCELKMTQCKAALTVVTTSAQRLFLVFQRLWEQLDNRPAMVSYHTIMALK